MAAGDSHSDVVAKPYSYKGAALEALNDWQSEVAADREANPTELNAELSRSLTTIIGQLERL